MRKTHSFKVWGVKIDLKKLIIYMWQPNDDGLFSHLKPNKHLPTNEGYLLPHQI
jgi:hypothetical protein